MGLSLKDKGVIVGSGTLWYPKEKLGYVWEDVAYQGYSLTAGCFARSYLANLLEASGRKRVGWDNRCFGMLERNPPQFVRPCKGSFQGYDIKAAFWTIYSKLAIDFQYWGDKWGQGTTPYSLLPDWWGDDKLIRNAAIGCMRARSIGVWDGTGVQNRPMYNKLLSPMLWGFICDLLNEIATKALEAGAIYYNVDGGIWREEDWQRGYDWAAWVDSLGFNVLLQYEGEGEILSGGNWRLGEVRRGIGTASRESTRLYSNNRVLEIWRLINRESLYS